MELPANSGLAPLVCHPAAEINPVLPAVFQTGRVVTVLSDIQNRPQGKTFDLLANGQIDKKLANHPGDYWARSVHVPDLAALAELIAGFGPADVLILGCIPDAGFDPYRITPQRKLIRQLGIPRDVRPTGVHTIGGTTYAARLKENFIPCRYLLIDRDPGGAPPGVADLDDEKHIRLINIAWPGVATCERITFSSSSGRVAYADGRPALTAGASSHTYIDLAGDAWRNWDDLRIRQEAAGWNAGLGFTVTAKGGATLKRLPWDTSVFSVGREVFESAPAVGPGLLLLPRSYQHTRGGQCPPPPALTAESVAATRRETGAKISGSRAVAVDTTGALRADTRIETQRYGVLTVAEYVARNGDRTRCQTPFRASASWNGILGRTKQGGVYLHDNGIRQTYFLAGVVLPASEPFESPAGVELKGPTLKDDLRRLTNAPVEQCRATARAILARYAPQSPRGRPFFTLRHEVQAALPPGHSAGLPRSLGAFCDWLERQARQRAVQSSQIDPAKLAELKIEYRRIQTLEGLHSEILQHPDPMYLIRAPHGAGKTEEVLRPLSQALRSICAITNRVSLVADLCHRLNLSNYQTVRARDAEVTAALGICLPSVVNPKFNEILIQADGLLIDEISAVLREVHTPGGTLKTNGPEAARRLAAMFNQCRVVVGVDADLSTLDIETIASMTARKIVVYDMEQRPHDGRVSFADADNIKTQILTAVANGEKCRVACDSSATAIELTAYLRALHPDLNILCIHSRQGDSTAGDPAVINLLRDINAGLPRIDVLIHSPTLESGVSITVPHFDRTFGIFGGRSVAPAGFVQMLKRDRTATHFEIGFAGNCRQKLPTHPRAILSALEATHKREVEIIGDSPGASGLIRIEPATPFDDRVCQYRAARNADVNDAANNLLLLLESRGYRIAPCAAATAMSPEERQEARRLADEAYREAVLDAAVIDAPERAELQQRYHLNPAETAEAERYDAALANGMKPADLTAEALRLYEHGRLLSWNRRFDLLNAAPMEGLPGSVSDADYLPALALRRFDLAANEAYQTLFETAGLDWRTGKGEVDAASALECWRDLRASACRLVLEHTGICRFDAEPAYPVRWLGDALRKFGLALEAAPGDRKERGYILQQATLFSQDAMAVHAPGLEVMQRLWQTRQERRNILESHLPDRTRHPMQPALV